MNKLQTKIIRFMNGRYGKADDLNVTFVISSLVLILLANVLKTPVLSLLGFILLVLADYRMFSKNIVKRVNENRIFREKTVVLRRFFKARSVGFKDSSSRYYLCPSCHQICRVPKGKGKVDVRCPKCGTSFSRKS